MEPTNGAAEVLDGHVFGSEDEEDSVFVVDGERGGLDGGGDDFLHAEAGEGVSVGVFYVGMFTGDEDGFGNVGAGLICVESESVPPV